VTVRQGNVGIALEKSNHNADRIFAKIIVLRQTSQEGPTAHPISTVKGARYATIGRPTDDMNARVGSSIAEGNLGTAIGARIVDDDDLNLLVRLAQTTFDRRRQETLALVGRDDDRHQLASVASYELPS